MPLDGLDGPEDSPAVVAATRGGEDRIVEALDSQLHRRDFPVPEKSDDIIRNIIRSCREADAMDPLFLEVTPGTVEIGVLDTGVHGSETAAEKSEFNAGHGGPCMPGVLRDEIIDIFRRGKNRESSGVPLAAENAAVGATGMGDEDRDGDPFLCHDIQPAHNDDVRQWAAGIEPRRYFLIFKDFLKKGAHFIKNIDIVTPCRVMPRKG